MKAKVVEITESAIKFKKWDNLNGPLYNTAKSDVFMIIYENGQREIIKQADNTPASTSPATAVSSGNAPRAMIDTAIDFKSLKVQYKPTRFVYWFQSPATLGVQQEFRMVKNVLNIGAATDYFMVEGYSQTLYSFYAAPYIAVNRISGNYKKQDKGFFINAKIGYSSLNVSIDGKSESAGGVMYGIGTDYFITRGIDCLFQVSNSAIRSSFSRVVFALIFYKLFSLEALIYSFFSCSTSSLSLKRMIDL